MRTVPAITACGLLVLGLGCKTVSQDAAWQDRPMRYTGPHAQIELGRIAWGKLSFSECVGRINARLLSLGVSDLVVSDHTIGPPQWDRLSWELDNISLASMLASVQEQWDVRLMGRSGEIAFVSSGEAISSSKEATEWEVPPSMLTEECAGVRLTSLILSNAQVREAVTQLNEQMRLAGVTNLTITDRTSYDAVGPVTWQAHSLPLGDVLRALQPFFHVSLAQRGRELAFISFGWGDGQDTITLEAKVIGLESSARGCSARLVTVHADPWYRVDSPTQRLYEVRLADGAFTQDISVASHYRKYYLPARNHVTSRRMSQGMEIWLSGSGFTTDVCRVTIQPTQRQYSVVLRLPSHHGVPALDTESRK